LNSDNNARFISSGYEVLFLDASMEHVNFNDPPKMVHRSTK